MKKVLFLVVIMSLFVSCTKGKETAANLVTDNLSGIIIKAEVDKLFKIEAETASIASAFCNTVVDILVPQLVQAGIPATWECSADNASDKVADLAKQGCAKL